jgi:hypothetical protein
MLLVNSNAFLLGAIVFLVILLSNIVYLWLCKIWKVKVTELSIFLNPGFSLLKKEINGTIYKLGWLPIGAYIKPLGMEKKDLQSIAIEELPFAFVNISRAKKVLFRLAPALVCLFAVLLGLYTVKGPGNILQATEEMFNYILFAVKTMFGLSSNSEFVKMTNNTLIDKNIVSFALILCMSTYLVLNSLSKITNLYPKDGKKANWLITLVVLIVTVFAGYLTFWKIPAFVFSFFSFRQNLSYIVSFLLGLYFIGVLIFILVMILVKLSPVKSPNGVLR